MSYFDHCVTLLHWLLCDTADAIVPQMCSFNKLSDDQETLALS